MTRKLSYLSNCVDLPAQRIIDMVDRAREVTYRTLMKHVDQESVKSVFPDYDWGNGHNLTLKKDWAVSYWKSKYNGVPCYYIQHSAIEYVFV